MTASSGRVGRGLLLKILAVGALLVGGLYTAESAGVSHSTPTKVQFQNVGNSSSNDKGKADDKSAKPKAKDKGDESNGNDDHCTDGHGKDGDKNKHCRPASGS